MTRITPFAFAVLEEIIKRKRIREAFLKGFPVAVDHVGDRGVTDRKALINALAGTDWVRWIEHVWVDIEDLARVAAQFGPLAEDYAEAMQRHVPEADRASAEKRAADKKTQMEVHGPKIWRWLHSMALGWDGGKENLETIISLITNAVPCGECKKHWVQMITEYPPKATNADELFAESVGWHNKVNVRLGKPEMTVEDARKIYSPAG